METQEQDRMAAAKEMQVPEWEHIAAQEASKDIGGAGAAKRPQWSAKGAFDKAVPPHKKYVGLSRRMFLWVVLGVFLVLLVLIISLAVSLPGRGGGSQNLPLPSNSGRFTGELTYFDTGLGACGETTTNADLIVSMSHILFDAAGSSSSTGGNSNANPLCGRMIRAQRYNEAAGAMRSVDLRVVDRCTGCAVDDLDTTETAFQKLASIADGRVDVTWAWL